MTGRPPGRTASSASPPADDPLFYELGSPHSMRISDARKPQFCARVFPNQRMARMARRGEGEKRRRAGNQVETFGTQPETGTRFFYLDSLNSLKSPESAKGIQGNPRTFPWICLVFLGFICMDFALRLCRRLRNRFRRRGACSVQSIGAGLPPSSVGPANNAIVHAARRPSGEIL